MLDTLGMEALLDAREYDALSDADRDRLLAMRQDMVDRGLPPEVVASGLRSTAALLIEHHEAARSRIDGSGVQEFLEANGGRAIAKTDRTAPRRETRAVAREHLHDRLSGLMAEARGARRKHEILSVRRDLLAIDQAYVHRTLGADGDALCADINEWLTQVATRLNRGGL